MSNATILVVDDDEIHLSLLVDVLGADFGSEVTVLSAESVTEATHIVRSQPISILITDMYMDGQPDAGFDLIRLVKRFQPRTFVVVVTAYAAVRRIPPWMRAGAFEVLEKPFYYSEITGVIRRALDLGRAGLDRDSLAERLIVEEWNIVRAPGSRKKKGASLENFCSLLFGSIEGWQNIESRLAFKAEEIDIVVLNESPEEFWKHFGVLLLVECKNWSSRRKPGRADFDQFYMKLRRRSPDDCRLGFFISMNGFAKTFLEEVRRIAAEPQVIVPLDRSALWDLVLAPDRGGFLKDHVRQQVLGGDTQ